jgi:hypothetical protein
MLSPSENRSKQADQARPGEGQARTDEAARDDVPQDRAGSDGGELIDVAHEDEAARRVAEIEERGRR